VEKTVAARAVVVGRGILVGRGAIKLQAWKLSEREVERAVAMVMEQFDRR
jgi:hypothetical protein